MQFSDLVWGEYMFAGWEASQPLLYRGVPVRISRSKSWQHGVHVFDVDHQVGGGHEILHDDIPLLELCSAVLPFCTPVTEEGNDEAG